MNLSSLITPLFSGIVTLAIIFLLLLVMRSKVENWMLFVHFGLVFLFIQCLYIAGNTLQVQLFPGLQYAWIAKILSLLFVLGFYYFLFPVLFRGFGLTIRFDPNYLRLSLLLGGGLILFKCITNYLDPSRELVTVERFLFQLTLPGLEEELVFRGLFLVLFKTMLTDKSALFGSGWALDAFFVTLLFALVHSLEVNAHFRFSFNVVLFGSSFLAGFVYMWLREKHDSLAPAVVCHNAVNTLITLIQWIK